MPGDRLKMRRIRDVLRLKFGQGLSERTISASLGLGKSSVGSYVSRAVKAGLSWPLPEGLTILNILTAGESRGSGSPMEVRAVS